MKQHGIRLWPVRVRWARVPHPPAPTCAVPGQRKTVRRCLTSRRPCLTPSYFDDGASVLPRRWHWSFDALPVPKEPECGERPMKNIKRRVPFVQKRPCKTCTMQNLLPLPIFPTRQILTCAMIGRPTAEEIRGNRAAGANGSRR